MDYRLNWLIDELASLYQHSDLGITYINYDMIDDIIYFNARCLSPPLWAWTSYEFGNHEGMKYDSSNELYGIDGQPRIRNDGIIYVRYKTGFLDGSRVALNIWSHHPSRWEGERQIAKFYALFKVIDGLEPIEVFRKFCEYSD